MINEPEIAEKVRSLLRRYGWETGLRKLEEEIAATPDPGRRNNMLFFAGWMAAERGAYEEAQRLLKDATDGPSTRNWVWFVQAFLAMRRQDFLGANGLLDSIEPEPEDGLLKAAAAHLRGAAAFHTSDLDRALRELRDALRLLGKGHYGGGRILDTFGMVYAARDNFHAAEEFFQQAVALKKEWDDQPGLAVSYGNLGRLNLDWGCLEQAEAYFFQDLAIAQNTHDGRGEAIMRNCLGRVALECGKRSAAAARPSDARKQWADAAGWLDASIQAAAGRWTINEAYARKDRALLHLAEDQVEDAEAEAREAENLFRSAEFAEGLAHLDRTWGMIHRQRGCFVEAKQKLRAALDHFGRTGERAEQARTQWEIALLSRASGEPRPLITREYLSALDLAESCRRAQLVRGIGEDLRAVNAEAHAARVFRRVRGRGMPEDTDSLTSGSTEPLTVLFLDIKSSTSYALDNEPEVVMTTLNQMMADMVAALRRHDALVSVFRGDGFMAMFRGHQHAIRAVSAALDLCRQMDDFNEPRAILGLRPFAIRVGVSTGDAVLGNVGTYDLMDYTAIGTAVNLGARLESEAEPGVPCVSRRTHDDVRDRFLYSAGSPRPIVPKGMEELGEQLVWDVTGKAPRAAETTAATETTRTRTASSH